MKERELLSKLVGAVQRKFELEDYNPGDDTPEGFTSNLGELDWQAEKALRAVMYEVIDYLAQEVK